MFFGLRKSFFFFRGRGEEFGDIFSSLQRWMRGFD